MTIELFLLILIGVFIPIATFYLKRRLDHSLRVEFDRQIETMRRSFQLELASIQAVYNYRHLAIKASFDEVVKLNDLLWPAYWAHQDLWSFDEMDIPQRERALHTIQQFRAFLFSHQIFLDAEIYETSIQAVTKMLALSRYRAVNRHPPQERDGSDMNIENEISAALGTIVRMIRSKFELPSIPEDLRIPQRPEPIA